MEQVKLSRSAIAQIVGSALILLGVFMSWITAGGFFSITLSELFAMMNRGHAGIAGIIPYAMALMAIGNMALVYLKGNKILSIVLTLCVLLLAAFIIILQHDSSDLRDTNLGTGFFFCILGMIALIFGVVTKK